MPTRISVENLDESIRLLTEEVEGIVRDMTTQTSEVIEDLSPVDTGFFRFNWNLTFGTPNATVRGVRDPNRKYGPPQFNLANLWKISQGRVYFTNGVDYAGILDRGRSAQAPQGVTEPTAAIIESRFRVVA